MEMAKAPRGAWLHPSWGFLLSSLPSRGEAERVRPRDAGGEGRCTGDTTAASRVAGRGGSGHLRPSVLVLLWTLPGARHAAVAAISGAQGAAGPGRSAAASGGAAPGGRGGGGRATGARSERAHAPAVAGVVDGHLTAAVQTASRVPRFSLHACCAPYPAGAGAPLRCSRGRCCLRRENERLGQRRSPPVPGACYPALPRLPGRDSHPPDKGSARPMPFPVEGASARRSTALDRASRARTPASVALPPQARRAGRQVRGFRAAERWHGRC